jgi:hypothetical protein
MYLRPNPSKDPGLKPPPQEQEPSGLDVLATKLSHKFRQAVGQDLERLLTIITDNKPDIGVADYMALRQKLTSNRDLIIKGGLQGAKAALLIKPEVQRMLLEYTPVN